MNVLITSLSRKVPLLAAVREALRAAGGGLVWGGDTDAECVGRYFTDRFWQMPPLAQPDAAEQLIAFCASERIGLVIPTRDGELPWFAALRDDLAAAGAYVPVGSPDAVDVCLDKLRFHDHCCTYAIPVVRTAATLDELDGDRFVVKERRGAGSRALAIGIDRQAAIEHAAGLDEPIFQPVAAGVEHSVDIYVNRAGRVVDAAPRTRIRVHDGEAVVTETVDHRTLVAASVRLAESLALRGHLVVQGLVQGDEVTLLECNARVGGASTCGFHAGIASPRWAIEEARGATVAPRLGAYRRGLRLVRYPADHLVQP